MGSLNAPSRQNKRQDNKWVCPPCRRDQREQQNRSPPCFWFTIRNFLGMSAAALSTAIGEVLAALFFFAFIALLSFYLPPVARVWNPELACLQRSVDRMVGDLAVLNEELKETELSVCKLCEGSNLNKKKSCIEKLSEKLGFKSSSKNMKNADCKAPCSKSSAGSLPPATEESPPSSGIIRNTPGSGLIRNPSEEYCETSRKLYKKPLKQGKVRNGESTNQQKLPGSTSSLFQKW